MVASPATTQLSFKAEDLPIKSVTVFRPSGAQLVRILKANLKVRCRLAALSPAEDLIAFHHYAGWEQPPRNNWVIIHNRCRVLARDRLGKCEALGSRLQL